MVFAAASLKEAFTEMGAAFQAKHPGTTVVFQFAGTPTLRTQLEQGATADVFASANQQQMDLALKNGVVEGEVLPFAANILVVITPAQGASVTALSDLAKPGTKLVLALKDVPAGAYARQSLDRMAASGQFAPDFMARVLDNVVSEETDVRQVVAKVALGEADAGIVYKTDVTKDVAARVRGIEIPAALNVSTLYPVARVRGGPNPEGAARFVAFLRATDGQAILAKHGFVAPPE